VAELTAPWRSRPRLPESPLGRNVIHRQAAPVAKGGERRGERGQEGEGRGSSQSGAVHRVALPSSRNRRHHSMRGRLLGSAGLRSTRRAQSVHSSLGERGLTTPSMHRQVPHRRACGVPGQSSREEEERGEGGRGSGRSPRRRALWGFRPPPVTHFSAALSHICRITTSLRRLDRPGAR
jgi:hypothetical protein